MTIAFDAASGAGDGSNTTSRTVSHTCTGSDRALVLGVQSGATPPSDIITGATYNGVSMTLVAKLVTNSSHPVYLFYLSNPASGTHDIVVSASGSQTILMAAASYTGVNQSGQPEAFNSLTAQTSASVTVAVTTVTDNAWTVLVAGDSAGTVGAGTGSTKRAGDGLAGDLTAVFDSNGPISPAASNSMTATAANAAVSCNGIIISMADVSSTPPVPDTPELYGTPFGSLGQRQTQQLLSQ